MRKSEVHRAGKLMQRAEHSSQGGEVLAVSSAAVYETPECHRVSLSCNRLGYFVTCAAENCWLASQRATLTSFFASSQ
jgi:hypothetical protein